MGRYAGITLTAAQQSKRNREIGTLGACRGDSRFITPSQNDAVIEQLLAICAGCPVRERTPSFDSGCRDWAREQILPVGFVVAGGMRWRSWTHCEICGRRCRGLPRCREHGGLDLDGTEMEATG